MIVDKDVIKFSNKKEEKTYKCKSKILALGIKKLLKNNKDIRIIKMNIKHFPNTITSNLTIHFWSYADRIQTEKLLREKYIFVSLCYGEMLTNK